MDTVIAKRISYLIEEHSLLPEIHIGGRKRRSTEHALHNVLEIIYEAWNKRASSKPAPTSRIRSI
jgi:hypothetical protein